MGEHGIVINADMGESFGRYMLGNDEELSRGRNAGYPAPPAQIPACGTTAPGSCLRY